MLAMRLRLGLLAALSAAGGALGLAQNVTCATGLYMIVARGSGEEEGTGITGTLADRIAHDIEGSDVSALDYPATITDPDYQESSIDGVEALQKAIIGYHSACPDGKMALLGYSQVKSTSYA